jgi:hypothetical protein
MTPGGIDANAHDLGIVGGELVEISTVRRHLLASSGRPIERIKRQHHVLLVPKIAEPDFVPATAGNGGQFEIGSFGTNFEQRSSSPERHLSLH